MQRGLRQFLVFILDVTKPCAESTGDRRNRWVQIHGMPCDTGENAVSANYNWASSTTQSSFREVEAKYRAARRPHTGPPHPARIGPLLLLPINWAVQSRSEIFAAIKTRHRRRNRWLAALPRAPRVRATTDNRFLSLRGGSRPCRGTLW